MKVSFAVPVRQDYTATRNLFEDIASWEEKPREIILVYDSKDSPKFKQLAKEFSGLNVRYIDHSHERGYYAAANTAVTAASGDLVVLVKPQRGMREIEYQDILEALATKTTDILLISSDVETLTPVRSAYKCDHGLIIFRKKKVLKELEGFPEDQAGFELDRWLGEAIQKGFAVAGIPARKLNCTE